MYEKVNNFSIEGSCSALMNNLCCFMDNDKVHLACVHKSAVNVLVISPDGTSRCHLVPLKDSSSFKSVSMILQAKWVVINKTVMLVIASQRGIQVFDENGKILLCWYALPTNSIDSPEVTFTRGIAACGDNLLCIGTHDGIVLTFEIFGSSSIELVQSLKGHNTAITDLCGEEGKLASGDEEGVICLWERNKAFEKVKTLQKFGYPCTSLALWKDLILAAFGSGHLRLFRQSTGLIISEVTAHTRWITAVDIAVESGLGLSVSEDSFIRIWRLQNEKPVISHEYSCNVADTQLCGGCFMDPVGSAFFATGYDLKEVVKFSS